MLLRQHLQQRRNQKVPIPDGAGPRRQVRLPVVHLDHVGPFLRFGVRFDRQRHWRSHHRIGHRRAMFGPLQFAPIFTGFGSRSGDFRRRHHLFRSHRGHSVGFLLANGSVGSTSAAATAVPGVRPLADNFRLRRLPLFLVLGRRQGNRFSVLFRLCGGRRSRWWLLGSGHGFARSGHRGRGGNSERVCKVEHADRGRTLQYSVHGRRCRISFSSIVSLHLDLFFSQNYFFNRLDLIVAASQNKHVHLFLYRLNLLNVHFYTQNSHIFFFNNSTHFHQIYTDFLLW
uniref:(northern house mosquito) hypothetical protein n=1 Tax=Culex pipiens TaxID=7175 RepID=A0A8D8CBW5_CULPI